MRCARHCRCALAPPPRFLMAGRLPLLFRFSRQRHAAPTPQNCSARADTMIARCGATGAAASRWPAPVCNALHARSQEGVAESPAASALRRAGRKSTKPALVNAPDSRSATYGRSTTVGRCSSACSLLLIGALSSFLAFYAHVRLLKDVAEGTRVSSD